MAAFERCESEHRTLVEPAERTTRHASWLPGPARRLGEGAVDHSPER